MSLLGGLARVTVPRSMKLLETVLCCFEGFYKGCYANSVSFAKRAPVRVL